VPAAVFGGLVSRDLINAFATNRTKPNMNPPTTVPNITEAGIVPAFRGIERTFSCALSFGLLFEE